MQGVTRTSTWSQAVRNAVRKVGAEFQRQKVLIKAAAKRSKQHLRIPDAGLTQILQAACNFMDQTGWGWDCMLQPQDFEDREFPAATTWAADFLLREGESREFLGS